MKVIISIALILLFSPLLAFSQKIEYVTNDFCWLFLNIPNRMSIEAGDIPFSEIKIKTSDHQNIQVDTDGKFSFRTIRRRVTLKAYQHQGKDSSFICERTFEVKPLPKATARIGRAFRENQIEMSKGEFLAQVGINAPLVNYDFNVGFSIESFTIIVTRKNELVYLKDFKGGRFSSEMKNELKKLLKGGERILFTNIKIQSQFHFNKFINSIELKIKKEA